MCYGVKFWSWVLITNARVEIFSYLAICVSNIRLWWIVFTGEVIRCIAMVVKKFDSKEKLTLFGKWVDFAELQQLKYIKNRLLSVEGNLSNQITNTIVEGNSAINVNQEICIPNNLMLVLSCYILDGTIYPRPNTCIKIRRKHNPDTKFIMG